MGGIHSFIFQGPELGRAFHLGLERRTRCRTGRGALKLKGKVCGVHRTKSRNDDVYLYMYTYMTSVYYVCTEL